MTLYSIPANGSNGLRSGDFRVASNLPYQCGGTEVVIVFFSEALLNIIGL